MSEINETTAVRGSITVGLGNTYTIEAIRHATKHEFCDMTIVGELITIDGHEGDALVRCNNTGIGWQVRKAYFEPYEGDVDRDSEALTNEIHEIFVKFAILTTI